MGVYSFFYVRGEGRLTVCGIFGVIGHQLEESAITNTLKALEHRGPDGCGVYEDDSEKVLLGHTRLAVIDLETGEQPIESQDANITLVCNGEIYDFERIRAELEAVGYHFKTRSDSEVIIYLYERDGLDFFKHLRGEFAFLLYDKRKRIVLAVRDRFGIKPLFYTKTASGGVVFSSEIKGIFATGLVEPKLSPIGLDRSIKKTEAGPFPFEGIQHLFPASYAVVNLDDGKVTESPYWSRELPAESANPPTTSMEDCAALVLQELEEAVKIRLRADVPVGLYLSGGLDSSLVAALVSKNLKSKPLSFSISFVDSDEDEGEFARRAAEFVGTEHHDLQVTRKMLWESMEDCLWYAEMPFNTLACVGKYLLSREARKHVTVVLTGEGADEVFLGYRGSFGFLTGDPKPKRGFRRIAAALGEWFDLMMFHRKHRRRVAEARKRARVGTASAKPAILRHQEWLLAVMPFGILSFLGDRSEMAHSLEARVPFLDHKLYDMAKSISVEYKASLKLATEKAVVREAARTLLPEDLRERPKVAFTVTNAAEDFFGRDRAFTKELRPYLRKAAFERTQMFSYGTYLLIRAVVSVPFLDRIPKLKRISYNAQRAIIHILQAHILQKQFIEEPRWSASENTSAKAALAHLELRTARSFMTG
jgi:asparagine synthase (glutamine-hydrolysing)